MKNIKWLTIILLLLLAAGSLVFFWMAGCTSSQPELTGTSSTQGTSATGTSSTSTNTSGSTSTSTSTSTSITVAYLNFLYADLDQGVLSTGNKLSVRSMVFGSDSKLYVGGEFTQLGSSHLAAQNIGRWNPSLAQWETITGLPGAVYALASYGNKIYAGGSFTTAEGATVNYVAFYDGSHWNAMGAGLPGPVHALLVNSESEIYAGGEFNYLAKWNGGGWTALRGNFNYKGPPVIYCLLQDASGNIYAGGQFTSVESKSALNIARWSINLNDWEQLPGELIADHIYAMVFNKYGDLLVGGGNLLSNGGLNIAKYTVSTATWSELASSLSGNFIAAVAKDSQGHLFTGGHFNLAGRDLTNNLAVYYLAAGICTKMAEGITGGAIGSGGPVAYCMLHDGTASLYVGGIFTGAGPAGLVANNIVRVNILP